MSRRGLQSRTRTEDIEQLAQSSSAHNWRRATSHNITQPLSSINTCGSPLKDKEQGFVRLFYENVNGLQITDKAWKFSHKCRRLKHSWKRLKVDVIALNETQINLELVNNSVGVAENLFRHDNHFTIMSNNKKAPLKYSRISITQ